MELSVKLSRVQILQKLLQFSGNLGVFVFGEQVHVPETVDGNKGQILFILAEVVQWVSKLDTICYQEIYVF